MGSSLIEKEAQDIAQHDYLMKMKSNFEQSTQKLLELKEQHEKKVHDRVQDHPESDQESIALEEEYNEMLKGMEEIKERNKAWISLIEVKMGEVEIVREEVVRVLQDSQSVDENVTAQVIDHVEKFKELYEEHRELMVSFFEGSLKGWSGIDKDVHSVKKEEL